MQREDAGGDRWTGDAVPAIVELGVAGIAWLTVRQIDSDPLADGMDMIVPGKGTGVAAVALATLADSRTESAAVGRVVAEGAAESGMGLAGTGERRGRGAMAALAVGGDRGAGRVGRNGAVVVVGVAAEVSRMTEGAAAWPVYCRAMAIGSGDQDAGERCVTQGAGAGDVVAMHGDDDIAAMAAGAGGHSGQGIVVLDGMVGKIGGVGGMAIGAVGSDQGGDGVDDRLAHALVAGGAGVDAAGRDVMQGHDLGCGVEGAMTAVALEAGQ